MNHKKGILVKKNGFTVWELILLLLILGILLALLIPFFLKAKEKAAQKSTMADMIMWSEAIMCYISEHSIAPTDPRGRMHFKKKIIKEVSPYLKAVRIIDWWENPFLIWTGNDIRQYGIITHDEREFIIASFSRDKWMEGWKYDPTDPEAGFFKVKDFEDFNKDLVLWNNRFIRCPK